MNTVNRTLAGVAFGTATSLVIITALATFGSRGVQSAEASVMREPEVVPRRNRVMPIELEEPKQVQNRHEANRPSTCLHLYYGERETKSGRYDPRPVPCETEARIASMKEETGLDAVGIPMLMPVAITDLNVLLNAHSTQEIIDRVLTSEAGERCDPTQGGCQRKAHEGWDFKAKMNTPVLSPFAGEILDVNEAGSCGKMVRIDFSKGKGAVLGVFCHLSSWRNDLRPGKLVERGEIIAHSGATGNATRLKGGRWVAHPHLHFELTIKDIGDNCRVVKGKNKINPLCVRWDFPYVP